MKGKKQMDCATFSETVMKQISANTQAKKKANVAANMAKMGLTKKQKSK